LPVNERNPETKIFLINKGEPIRTVATNLKKEGLIRDPLAFFIMVKRQNVEKYIQAGDFRLSTAMSASAILTELQHGTIDVWITIPEGWRKEEIALELAKELAIPENEFIEHAQEGYMFPDTYLFPREASGSAVAEKMLSTFDQKVTEPLSNQISSSGFTLNEIITLASIVEREALYDEERPMIASVLINRLNAGQALEVDATIQYIVGYQADEKDWWKASITVEDKELDSLYNTYKYPGIPPDPIANPGLSSINAVLNPAESDYLYYLHDGDGVVHFATTFQEHQRNIETYLR